MRTLPGRVQDSCSFIITEHTRFLNGTTQGRGNFRRSAGIGRGAQGRRRDAGRTFLSGNWGWLGIVVALQSFNTVLGVHRGLSVQAIPQRAHRHRGAQRSIGDFHGPRARRRAPLVVRGRVFVPCCPNHRCVIVGLR
jgi:hypothetical protein